MTECQVERLAAMLWYAAAFGNCDSHGENVGDLLGKTKNSTILHYWNQYIQATCFDLKDCFDPLVKENDPWMKLAREKFSFILG